MHNGFHELSLRTQLLLLAILLILPSVGIIIFNGYKQHEEDLKQVAVETQKLAANIAAEQERLTLDAQQLGKLLAQLPEVKQRDTAKVQYILTSILKDNPQYLDLVIADRSGNAWASAIPLNQPVSLADRRYFKNAVSSKRFSSGEYIIGKTSNKPTLAMGYPFLDKQGEVDGVIALSFNLDQMKMLLERSQLPKDTNYIITDHKGIIINRGHDAAGYVGTAIKPYILKKLETSPDKDTYLFVRADGDKRITTHHKLRLSGEQTPYMYVRAGISYNTAVTRAYNEILYNSTLLAPFVIIAFALVLYIGKRSISDRVAVLDSAAQQLARGSLPGKISDIVKGGELGRLGETFDDMARQLKTREQELVDKTQLLAELNNNLEQKVQRDLNDLRQKDLMLIQQNRQAAMGEMINNIAHQWRQPLNNIGLIIQNLQDDFETGQLTQEAMAADAKQAIETILYMSQTIDDFRNFFRLDKHKQDFLLNELLNRTLEFVSISFRNRNITINIEAQDGVTAHGYPNEFIQAMLNILNNARDAHMERKVSAPYILIRIFKEDGRAVMTVTDNAGGIPPEILPRIFEPYFSTKVLSKGTGIGLYMSKVIIEQHMNGRLTARNVECGAEFRIEV